MGVPHSIFSRGGVPHHQQKKSGTGEISKAGASAAREILHRASGTRRETQRPYSCKFPSELPFSTFKSALLREGGVGRQMAHRNMHPLLCTRYTFQSSSANCQTTIACVLETAFALYGASRAMALCPQITRLTTCLSTAHGLERRNKGQ